MLNLALLAATPLVRQPFNHLVAPGLLSGADLAAIGCDFPRVPGPGVYPLSELRYGTAFAGLIEEIQGADIEDVLGERFAMDLSRHPRMITVRGLCQKKDGRIHVDSPWKILTVLLYLNDGWDDAGGCLRLLRGPDDIDDAIAEVPPDGGTMVAFRPAANSYHGHARFVGRRRYVMFNWVADGAAARRELARHRMSARIKRYLPFAR